MKNIDIKSLIIGALLTSTIFLGVAAAGKSDAGTNSTTKPVWDDKQKWKVVGRRVDTPEGINTATGFQPFAVENGTVYWRKRIK